MVLAALLRLVDFGSFWLTLLLWVRQSQVLVRFAGDHAATSRACDEALLHQVGFNDVINGAFFFAHGGGQRVAANRAPREFVNNSVQ